MFCWNKKIPKHYLGATFCWNSLDFCFFFKYLFLHKFHCLLLLKQIKQYYQLCPASQQCDQSLFDCGLAYRHMSIIYENVKLTIINNVVDEPVMCLGLRKDDPTSLDPRVWSC